MAIKMDKNAFVFSDVNSFKYIPTENEDQNDFQFEMIGSSGVPFNNWYWGPLVFNFSGMEITKETIPILWDHDTSRPMGFSKSPTITPDHQMLFTDEHVTFLEDNDDVTRFVKESKQGMPYQASIRGEPSEIVYIPEGETAEINGQTFSGPLTCWNRFSLLECSVTLFGSDPNTESKAFKEGDSIELSDDIFVGGQKPNQFNNSNSEENSNMKWYEFKEKSPTEFEKAAAHIQEEKEKEMETKFSAERETLTTKLEKAELKFSEMETKFAEAEKENLVLKEGAIKFAADKVFNDRFTEAGLPERMHDKLYKFVDSSACVGEDGKLDTEAFAKVVDKELAEWDEFAEKPSKIQGAADPKVDNGSGDGLSFDADAIAEQMHKFSHTAATK